MKYQDHRHKQGFTLVEASAAVTIIVITLGMAIGGFMYTLKKTNESDVQSELDIDVQLAMERLKKDLRLSSLDEIFYYPVGPGPYTAISFPLAEDSDGDGLFELNADGSIIWDKTLVYHIWPSSPHQLRVTTFKNRNKSLTDAQRQEQLDSVVKTGSGSGTYNGGNASTDVVFENLLDWTIRPRKGIFDAYSATTERESVNMGFALISDGAHTFQFKVSGKNPASSGYNVGIDQLVVSPSYGEREAEAQLPVAAQSGASAVSQYVANGSWKGNHHLYFPATAPGNSFTLKMGNDRWEETNFGADGYIAENTKVVFDESISPKDFVVELEGNDTAWQAHMQTGAGPVNAITNSTMLTNSWIFVHLNGSELLTNGNWIAYNGKQCKLTFQAATNGNLQIDYAYIGPTENSETNSPWWTTYEIATFGGSTATPVLNPGESITSDWINMEINKTNNYVVFYRLGTDPNNCYPIAWRNNRTTNWDSYFYNYNQYTNAVFGLSAMQVSYPAKGTYTSQVFDTRLKNPIYNDIVWSANTPLGTAISTKVRTGNQPDLSDAAPWSMIPASGSNPRSVSASYKRYVQFQAELQSNSDGLSTPQLKDLTIDWKGELQLVNIGGIMTKGPDYGIIEVLVDGVPLQSALSIDLMIYKDIYSVNKKTKRVTSSLIADIRPRNTGM
jgi:type II secretory pathway pseudopilin PulG